MKKLLCVVVMAVCAVAAFSMCAYALDSDIAGHGGNTEPAPVTREGITGITITNPSSRTINLSSAGGSFTASMLSTGTPEGTITWNINAPSELNASITPNGTSATLSGTAPANSTTTAQTYTITINAQDNGTSGGNVSAALSVSETLTIIVEGNSASYIPGEGITGITITNPSSRTINLSSAGGSFTASMLSTGTPEGTITWNINAPSELNASITPNGTSATLSGTAPANSTTTAQTYTITINAQDNGTSGGNVSAALSVSAQLTITVEGQTPVLSPYRFSMSSGLQSKILSAFPGISEGNIYQLNDSEIIANSWTINTQDTEALALNNEKAVMNIPVIRAQNTGVYVLRLVLESADAGVNIKLRRESGNLPVAVSELQDMNCTFFDENDNVVTSVPQNKVVYAAMNLTAGTELRGVITTPTRVALGSVQVIEAVSQDTLREVITQIVNMNLDIGNQITSGELKFIAEENILPAPEPTQEIIEEAKKDDYNIVGKLNTLSVDTEGYYVFKVELTEELFKEVDGVNVDNLAIYGVSEDTEPKVASAFIVNGLMGTWELLTLSGEKMEFGIREFLMVGFLNAGKPVTIYLAKLILALLGFPVGCNFSGLGFAGCSGVFAVMIVVLLRKKRSDALS